MREMVKFINEKEATALGFTGSRVAKFYKKNGFKIKAYLRQRFFPDYPKKEVAHWGFYIDGKEKLISNLLNDKIKIKMPRRKW